MEAFFQGVSSSGDLGEIAQEFVVGPPLMHWHGGVIAWGGGVGVMKSDGLAGAFMADGCEWAAGEGASF